MHTHTKPAKVLVIESEAERVELSKALTEAISLVERDLARREDNLAATLSYSDNRQTDQVRLARERVSYMATHRSHLHTLLVVLAPSLES